MPSPMTTRACLAASSLLLSLLAAGCAEPLVDSTPASDRPADDDTTSSQPTDPESSASDEPTVPEDGDGTAVPAYFVTDTSRGPRLVREFHRVQGDALTEAALLVTGGGVPDDPDYRTLWPGGSVASVEATDGLLVVRLEDDAFTEAPDGMPRREARLALQQLVYTLQGVQQARVPVQIVRDSGPARLFGLDVSAPLKQASPLRVLNHVNITSPEEGSHITGDDLAVSGVANSFEANVVCQVEVGEEVLAQQPLTAAGWMGDRLFPFEGTLDTTEVPSGEALLRCSTDDPSGGAEGAGAMTDTKTVTLD